MKRRTAIRLYQFLIAAQVVGFIVGAIQLTNDIITGVYRFLPAYFVGAFMGWLILLLWFRRLKQAKSIREDH